MGLKNDTARPAFTSTDAWILAALALCHREEGAPLDAISSAADYLNHAIPTQEELKSALAKLELAGLARARGERFSLDGDALGFRAKLERVAAFRWIEKSEQFLAKPAKPSRPRRPAK
jgi:hypothetical protein